MDYNAGVLPYLNGPTAEGAEDAEEKAGFYLCVLRVLSGLGSALVTGATGRS